MKTRPKSQDSGSTGRPPLSRVILFFATFFLIVAIIVGATVYLIYNSLNMPRHDGKAIAPGVTVSTFVSYKDENVFPVGLALSPDGTFYLTLFGSSAIDKVDLNGARTAWVSAKGQITSGGPIVFGPDKMLYLIDYSSTVLENAVGNLQRLSPDGTVTSFGDLPNKKGFSLFAQMSFDSNGNLYITNPALGQVWRFTPDGAGIVWWTPASVGNDHAQPTGIAFDPAQKALVISDSGTGSLYRVPIGADGSAGNPLLLFRQSGVDIRSIALDEQGRLLLAVWARENGQLSRFDDGQLVVIADGFRAPTTILYRAGMVYVVNSDLLGLIPSYFFGLIPSPLRARPPFTVDMVNLAAVPTPAPTATLTP